ncbi:MAG: hypothetical protein O7B99_00320 [Planctomycetota bacterium]|nr:hypothetical protein [Planctomycetota bacterium]
MASAAGKAMSKAKKGSIWPKALGKAAKLIQKQDYDKSYAEVLKRIEGGKLSDGDGGTAAMFQSYLEGLADAGLAQGQKHLDEGFVCRGVQTVAYWAGTKSTLPATADCRQLLQELQAVPDFKKEMTGGALYEEALVCADDRAYSEAIDLYKKIVRKAGGTKIADHARSAAQELIDDGMAGYKSVCQSCQEARRACAKHKEDVEI